MQATAGVGRDMLDLQELAESFRRPAGEQILVKKEKYFFPGERIEDPCNGPIISCSFDEIRVVQSFFVGLIYRPLRRPGTDAKSTLGPKSLNRVAHDKDNSRIRTAALDALAHLDKALVGQQSVGGRNLPHDGATMGREPVKILQIARGIEIHAHAIDQVLQVADRCGLAAG